MKQLTCEMCGSTDLIKQDGVFVCQTCGCKYSIEEAKRMMVEGTVSISGPIKIDNEARIDNLYILARREWENLNYVKAGEYYSQIVLENPNDWEASFYSTLCQATICRIASISSEALLVKNCISTVFSFVKGSKNPEGAYQRIAEDSIKITNLLFSGAKAFFSEHNRQLDEMYPFLQPRPASNYEAILKLMREFEGQYISCVQVLSECGSQYDMLYGQIQKEYCKEYALSAWKRILSIEDEAKRELTYSIYHDAIGNFYENQICAVGERIEQISAPFIAKIKKYEPDYISDSEARKQKSEEPIVRRIPISEITGQSTQSGCYIATTVYGSYDCPQVWTLRRYRDHILAETWYGRAFIRVYYAVSPTLVKWFGEYAWFKNLWKPKLDKMVELLNRNGVADTPYKDRNW